MRNLFHFDGSKICFTIFNLLFLWTLNFFCLLYFSHSISNSCTTQGLNSHEETAGRSLLFLHFFFLLTNWLSPHPFTLFACVSKVLRPNAAAIWVVLLLRTEGNCVFRIITSLISCLCFHFRKNFLTLYYPFLQTIAVTEKFNKNTYYDSL